MKNADLRVLLNSCLLVHHHFRKLCLFLSIIIRTNCISWDCSLLAAYYLEVMNLADDKMKGERTKKLSGWYCDDDLPVESTDCRFIDHVYIVCDIYS
jgi:hypothetical protein